MNLKTTSRIEPKYKDKYVMLINTMEGDADDYHTMEFYFSKSRLKKLRQMIVAVTVLSLCYPNGRGGQDDYVGRYARLFLEDLYVEPSYGITDTIQDFSVVYYDKNGGVFNVDIDYDEKMVEEIITASRLTEAEKITMHYPTPDKILLRLKSMKIVQ